MLKEGKSESDMPKVTLKIEESTREKVRDLGKMDDTFDSVISRLVDEHFELQKLKEEIDKKKK